MPSSSTTTHLSPAELAYLHSSLFSDPPIRPDSRHASDFRPFSAETDVLPNTMGSAHVGFADGREAVVGIRGEVERSQIKANIDQGQDQDMTGTSSTKPQGRSQWLNLSLTLPGLRDDDGDLVFLEEMLREVLVTPSNAALSLQDSLVINSRWHWRLFVDVVLISPPEGSAGNSFPLPMLSMAIHLALRDTRIPRLKSEGEEDPLADDDWEASLWLYSKPGKKGLNDGVPPVTLLIMAVGDNVIFDPSGVELAVADGVFAVSIGRRADGDAIQILGLRMLETNARNTFKGVAKSEDVNEWDVVPGVWKPKVGGIKRTTLMSVSKAVMGVAGKDIIGSLEAFIVQGG